MKVSELYNENDYLEGIMTNNHFAIASLYRLHFPIIEQFILSNSGNHHDARDVYQDSFTILIQNVRKNTFRQDSKLGTYLYSICRRQWLKELNRRRHVMVDFQEVAPFIELEKEEDLEITNQELRFEKLDHALVNLSDKCQNLIRRFYILKESMDQIASALGYTNADNAKNQKYKCFKRLKSLYFANQNNQ